MKNPLLLLFTLLALSGNAQVSSTKKYVLLEHFTNSWCGICASRNPAFFNTIGAYPDDIHHLAVHPSVPYINCVFYQANTIDNGARQQYYAINGTPRVALNGTLLPPSNPLLPVNTLTAALTQSSPLGVQVLEAGSASERTATVTLKTFGIIPTGNYVLHVAVVEKLIELATPNGENMHHDVLRNLLTPESGLEVTLPALNEGLVLDFTYTISNNWNNNQIYVLAFVQEVSTKAVLNSGTRFDPLITGTDNVVQEEVLLSPNPATSRLLAHTGAAVPTDVSVFDLAGRQFPVSYQAAGAQTFIAVENLPSGMYLLRITTDKGLMGGKFIKE